MNEIMQEMCLWHSGTQSEFIINNNFNIITWYLPGALLGAIDAKVIRLFLEKRHSLVHEKDNQTTSGHKKLCGQQASQKRRTQIEFGARVGSS